MKHRRLAIYCVSLFLLLSAFSAAQENPNLANGLTPYGSYHGGDIDSVSVINGGLALHAPLVSYAQRGSLKLDYYLVAGSKNWSVVYYNPNPTQSATYGSYVWTSKEGTFTPYGVYLENTLNYQVQRKRTVQQTAAGNEVSTTDYMIVTPDGSQHRVWGPPTWTAGQTDSYRSVDATGLSMTLVTGDAISAGTADSITIVDRAGNQYYLAYLGAIQDSQKCDTSPGQQTVANYCTTSFSDMFQTISVTDVDGNTMQLGRGVTDTTDTLGRVIMGSGAVNSVTCSGEPTTPFNVPTFGGGTGNITVCYEPVNLQTAFNQPNIGEATIPDTANPYIQMWNYQPSAIGSVTLQNQTSWNFQYDSYGNVTNITLPTGGQISYTWQTIPLNCADGSFTQVSRAVLTRTVSGTGIPTGTWTYKFGPLQSNGTMTNVVTDPAGNDTVHVVSAIGGTGSCSYYETQTRYYQGPQSANNILKTVNTAYSYSPSTGGGFNYTDDATYAYNVYPQTVTTILPNGLTSQVVTTQDSGTTVDGVSLVLGSVVSKKEYDYGQGSPGALIRQTADTYAWQQNPAYLAANILDAKSSIVVEDGQGDRCGEQDSTFDEPAYLTSTTFGTANQHLAAPNGSVRGNETTSTHWVGALAPSTSSCQLQAGQSWSTFSTHTNYYDTGEVHERIDGRGNATTYLYDPAYWGAYQTETINALGQTVSGTYDFRTGLVASITDANGSSTASGNTPGDQAHTDFYTYDNMFRIHTVSFPGGGTTTFQNNDTPGSLNVQETQLQIAPSTAITNTVSFDSLGRKTQSALLDPEGTDTTVLTYDAMGRVSQQFNPTRSFSSSSTPYTQAQYDGMGREIAVTQQDGGVATTSYNSNCTTVTDEAGIASRNCTDGLGRIVEVDEPGGTTGFPSHGDVSVNAVNGSGLQTIMAGASPGSAASGTIAISGEDTTSDSGTLTIQVGTTAATISYGYLLTAQTIAQNVATYFNQNSTQVSAVASQVTDSLHWQIKFTAKQVGTSGNLAFTTSHTSFYGTQYPFAYTFSPASGSLSGGVNAITGTPVTDYGTVTASLNGNALTVCYGPNPSASCNGVNNSTTAQVAAALMAPYQNSPWWGTSVVQSSAASTMFLVYAKNNSAANNGTVTVTSTTALPQYFAQGSFNGGGTLSGGLDPSPASLSTPLVTLYQYDPIGNLICVEQHGDVFGTGCGADPSNDATSPWRVRRHSYDSLSRLLHTTNPESGTTTYQYDNSNNVVAITDARGITVNASFDALNRPLGKTYSNGEPAVSYSYDSGVNGIGHRTGMTDVGGSETWTYDVLGRISGEQRTINGIQRSVAYTYYLDGELKTLQYPNGDTLTYKPSYAGRLLSITDTANGISYLSNGTYTPDGQPSGYTNGNSGSFAGIQNSFGYNSRLQLASASAASPTQTLLNIAYDLHVGNGDNGDVWAVTNNNDPTRNQAFTYDALNRVATAQNAGVDCTQVLSNGASKYWANNYTYDAWGNLLTKTPTKCSSETLSLGAAVNNRLIGNSYDAAGNMTSGNGMSFSYDAEGRLSAEGPPNAAPTNQYYYDGDGNRVGKFGANSIIYWYGTPGVLAETDLSGNPLHEYIFYNGKRLARRDASGQTYGPAYFYFSNRLESTSVIADSGGNVQNESDYYPWGGELPITSKIPFTHKFTGMERDGETGLDNFKARYYADNMARFMSPDPLGGNKADPQSLNRYAYVRGNPMNFTDPTGMYTCRDDDKCGSDDDKAFEQARWRDLTSGNSDVVKAAMAYGDKNADNGVSVGFGDLKGAEDGLTVVTIGASDHGRGNKLVASVEVTIDTKTVQMPQDQLSDYNTARLDSAVAHEGSHVADGQVVVPSLNMKDLESGKWNPAKEITHYQSEQRAFKITDAVLKANNKQHTWAAELGGTVTLGAGGPTGKGLVGAIDKILNTKQYGYLTPSNQGGSIVSH